MLRRVEMAYVAVIERAISTAHSAADRYQPKLGVAVRGETPIGAPLSGAPLSQAISLEALGVALPQLANLDRYKQRALARRGRAMQGFVLASVFPHSIKSSAEAAVV